MLANDAPLRAIGDRDGSLGRDQGVCGERLQGGRDEEDRRDLHEEGHDRSHCYPLQGSVPDGNRLQRTNAPENLSVQSFKEGGGELGKRRTCFPQSLRRRRCDPRHHLLADTEGTRGLSRCRRVTEKASIETLQKSLTSPRSPSRGVTSGEPAQGMLEGTHWFPALGRTGGRGGCYRQFLPF